VTHRYPELNGYADFVTGTRGTPLGLDGGRRRAWRVYGYYLGGCFYRAKRNEDQAQLPGGKYLDWHKANVFVA